MTATQDAEGTAAEGAAIERFEAEARAFLDAHAERRPEETFVWGQGSQNVSLFPEKSSEQQQADLAASRAWAQKVFDAGFGWITGPEAYGGRGLPEEYQRTWNRVAAEYQTPSLSIYGIGLGMVAPTILAHATDQVKEAYLRRMWRGDIVACQLFSEPSSGSDLASLQTRAVRDGDEWVVNGQKVWTSGAQVSDIGEIICRTDPDLPKHRGLTGFVVDMHAPGVEDLLGPGTRRRQVRLLLLGRLLGEQADVLRPLAPDERLLGATLGGGVEERPRLRLELLDRGHLGGGPLGVLRGGHGQVPFVSAPVSRGRGQRIRAPGTGSAGTAPAAGHRRTPGGLG